MASFILEKAAKPDDAPAASASVTIAPTYRLDADDAKLSPHVGHKVEITGTVENEMPSAAARPPASGAASAPKLKVENVKMVAANCTP